MAASRWLDGARPLVTRGGGPRSEGEGRSGRWCRGPTGLVPGGYPLLREGRRLPVCLGTDDSVRGECPAPHERQQRVAHGRHLGDREEEGQEQGQQPCGRAWPEALAQQHESQDRTAERDGRQGHEPDEEELLGPGRVVVTGYRDREQCV